MSASKHLLGPLARSRNIGPTSYRGQKIITLERGSDHTLEVVAPTDVADFYADLLAAAPLLLEALEPFAEIAKYTELRDAMAAVARPHERAAFLAALERACAAMSAAREGSPPCYPQECDSECPGPEVPRD